MKSLWRVAGWNLAVLVTYSIVIHIVSTVAGGNVGLGFATFLAFAMGVHIVICMVLMVVFYARNDGDLGRAWLLSAVLVLLVGFSVCLGTVIL